MGTLETLSVKDIQRILQIGSNSAYALIRSNEFPVIKVGHSYRIPKDDFYEWMHRQSVAAKT